MLSPAELEAIGKVTAQEPSTRDKPLAPGVWRLDGVIYKSATDWTIWLNGQKYDHSHQPKGLNIISVSRTEVEMKGCDDIEGESVVLCVGQAGKV